MTDDMKNNNNNDEREHILDDPQLTAYALGEIDDPDERARLERLVAENAEAQQFVDEIRSTADLLTGELKAEASSTMSHAEEEQMAEEAVASASSSTTGDVDPGEPIPFASRIVRSPMFKLSAGLAAAAVVTMAVVVPIVLMNRVKTGSSTSMEDRYAGGPRIETTKEKAPASSLAERESARSAAGGRGGAAGGKGGGAPMPGRAEADAADEGFYGFAEGGEIGGFMMGEGGAFEQGDAYAARQAPREYGESEVPYEEAVKQYFGELERKNADASNQTDSKALGARSGLPPAAEDDDRMYLRSRRARTLGDQADGETDIATVQPNIDPNASDSEKAVQFVEGLIQDTEKKVEAGQYADAMNQAEQVRDLLERQPDDIPEDKLETLGELTSRLVDETRAQYRASAIEEAKQEMGTILPASEKEKRDLEIALRQRIADKLATVRHAQAQGNYDEALIETEALLFLDPENPAALALRDTLRSDDAFLDGANPDVEIVSPSDEQSPVVGDIPLIGETFDRLHSDPDNRNEFMRKWIENQRVRDMQVANEEYSRIVDNPFKAVEDEPLSTFSIDVDTASYSNVRRFINEMATIPPADAVRIEELINNFDYDYEPPTKDAEHPFAVHTEIAECPWNPDHRLAKIGLKGYEVAADDRPATNLVFLIDSSGSMRPSNKLPLIQQSLTQMVGNLTVDDRIAIVTYAGSSRLVLDSTSVFERGRIIDAINSLGAGGSTNGEGGIIQAYNVAVENFIEGGTNGVILCTDGDFNVGTSDENGLHKLIEEKRQSGVFLSVLGFGMGNYKDNKLELLADNGNGNYAYIDNYDEAKKVLIDRMAGTLVTIAKDVKIQVDFNPTKVSSYRLIGYENRVMAAQDFNDDTKDAGEIGAGHTVTALYEVIPTGTELVPQDDVDDSVYVETKPSERAVESNEIFTVRLRYKQPGGDTSWLWTIPVQDNAQPMLDASEDFQFAASVASFGMILRQSPYRGHMTYGGLLDLAGGSMGEPEEDARGDRAEFLTLIRRVRGIAPQVFEKPKPMPITTTGNGLEKADEVEGPAPTMSDEELLARAVDYLKNALEYDGDITATGKRVEDGRFEVTMKLSIPAATGGDEEDQAQSAKREYTIYLSDTGEVEGDSPVGQ